MFGKAAMARDIPRLTMAALRIGGDCDRRAYQTPKTTRMAAATAPNPRT
jgi:hypothetical protein